MFSNSKQSIPTQFINKMKADDEWSAWKKSEIKTQEDWKKGRILRGAKLRTYDECARYIKEALKP